MAPCHRERDLIHSYLNPLKVNYFIITVKIMIIIYSTNSVNCQQNSGNSAFKPVNGNSNNKDEKMGAKLTDFITGNLNQRSLPTPKSQSLTLYNQNPGYSNYFGGGGGSVGNFNYNSLGGNGQGYFGNGVNPNSNHGFGQFNGLVDKGIGFPLQGPNFPPGYPFGQFPSPPTGPGFGGILKPGGLGYPPQFPFPPNPNLPLPPSGGGGSGQYLPTGFPGSLPYPPYYPQHQQQNNGGNNGIGHLYLGLPRQIRVPGRIEIALNGNDADIICEFPRFLILIQKVYWHHKYEDPYGTYYDAGNRFGPRVTVISVDKWKSILHIRDYNEDDFGAYRCLTAAVLPDESLASSVDNRGGGYFLRSPSTTTENTIAPTDFKTTLPDKSKSNGRRNGRDTKFPNTKIRFSRSISNVLEKSPIQNLKEFKILQPASSVNHGQQTNTIVDDTEDLKKVGSEEVYDPYFYNNYDRPTPRNYFLGGNHYPTSTISPVGGGGGEGRFNPFIGGGGGGGYPPNYYGSNSLGFGGSPPFAPYYKPSYGIFTIYQEIKFSPVIRTGNSSIRTNSV